MEAGLRECARSVRIGKVSIPLHLLLPLVPPDRLIVSRLFVDPDSTSKSQRFETVD